MALSLRRRGTPSGGAGVDIVVTQDDLRDLVKAINRYGDKKAVRRELSRGMREAVKPLVPKARAAVRSQGKEGRASTGLRADMARTVQMKVDLGLRSERIGVRIRLDGKKLRAPHTPGLAAMYEGAVPWRHPIFGEWLPGQPNQPHRGFLKEVVDQERETVMRKVGETCKDIGDDIRKRF